MKTYVISLKKNKERRNFVEQSMSINFEFFDAIYGIEQEGELRDKFEIKKILDRTIYQRLSAPQLGCYASHYQLWCKCVELNEPIVILEDDGLVSNILPQQQHIALIENNINKYGFLRLEPTIEKRRLIEQGTYESHFYEIFILRKSRVSTLGYAITPAVAKKFIENSVVWKVPVDNFIGDYHKHGVMLYQLYPYFKLRERNFDSDIVTKRQNFLHFSKRLWKINRKINDFKRIHFYEKEIKEVRKSKKLHY